MFASPSDQVSNLHSGKIEFRYLENHQLIAIPAGACAQQMLLIFSLAYQIIEIDSSVSRRRSAIIVVSRIFASTST